MQKLEIKKIILASLVLLFLNITFAEAKNYSYDSIDLKIQINKDSTFDVEEKLSYDFIGDFHAADRIISLNKISAITDIGVIDAQTGKLLRYVSSSKRLDHLNASNWGSFVSFKENGNHIIDWYFNLSDAKHGWIVKYKVHGGIGFFDDHDELYWNLFSGYDVPVSKSQAYVYLPQSVDIKNLEVNFYANIKTVSYKIIDGKTFYYDAINIPPRQPLTIYAGWPKGIVDQSAYWRDFLKLYWGYILGTLIILLSILGGFLRWYFTEVHNAGRGTIIPQYEPPQNLRPAMAEVIIKEKITDKAWPATIVDLAVRGYIKIKEDTAYWGDVAGRIFSTIFMLSILYAIAFPLIGLFNSQGTSFIVMVIPSLVVVFVLLFILKSIFKGGIKESFIPKSYIIEKIKPFENDQNLEDYERKFLGRIFGGKEYFSTKELKKSSSLKKQEFAKSFKELKDKLYEETELDTNAFENGISKEKIKTIILTIIIFTLFYFGGIAMANSYTFLVASAIMSGIGMFAFMKYEARLNKEGQILREDWLGFKMFLETAEKYRMQDLTPDTFEKYLPYAMIFGVEKKWAKAFESLNIQQPSWYASSAGAHGFAGGMIAGGGVGGFSPSAFSSSFSSSFASAFHSSTGGGSHGGGSAGGGGGGGGGGAR